MNKNFAKLCAIAIVGGVAKALFREPDTINKNTFNYPEAKSTDIALTQPEEPQA